MARKGKTISVDDWANTAKAMDRFRFGVVRDARQNLAIKQMRTVASGNTVNAAINNEMTLSQSLGSSRKNLRVTVWMEEYGLYVDEGRDPGKWPPVDAILHWVKTKPIKPRDSAGRFLPQTDSNMNSLAFLIGRAIDRYGIRETLFFTDPWNHRAETFFLRLNKEIFDDLDLILL